MISTHWTKKLTGAQKEEFEKTVRGSTAALRRLKEIVEEFEAELNRAELTLDTYSDASWSAKQAHINGMRHAYHRLSDLLSFLKD